MGTQMPIKKQERVLLARMFAAVLFGNGISTLFGLSEIDSTTSAVILLVISVILILWADKIF